MRMMARRLSPIVLLLMLAFGLRNSPAQEKPPAPPMGADRVAALDRISGDSLKGHLSFLASDLLEGRDTPSRGLDLAAEYIAAQFRRAGLEPIGDDGYFQTANWELSEQPRESFAFEVLGEGSPIKIGPDDVTLMGARNFHVDHAPLFKVDFKTYTELNREELAGKALLVELPVPIGSPEERNAIGAANGVFDVWAASTKAAALIVVGRQAGPPRGVDGGVLIDPKNPGSPPRPGFRVTGGRLPIFIVQAESVAKLLKDRPAGPIPAKFSANLDAAVRRPVKLRNVAGLLRGSDPALKDTYVLVTAHYDHVGTRGPQGTDRIYNGANDDGSGTVSVAEIGSALATLKDRPKRSILFLTFFGEEKGLLGSRYYGKNPLVPVDKTVADVNLEQVGRTDDKEGPRVGAACLTGFGYSDVSRVFVDSGEAEGIKVLKHPRNSDLFFGRSDNQALADLGVPAHTLCVAFDYPDYHGASDHWDKVDYANMAKIDRMVARALLTIADDPNEPKWDETNPRAAKYLKAWRDRRGK